MNNQQTGTYINHQGTKNTKQGAEQVLFSPSSSSRLRVYEHAPWITEEIVIIGAGRAGLAAAHELSRRGRRVLVLEKSDQVGGISRTLERNGYRFDIGGHRFFTKIDRVNQLWQSVLPNDFLRRQRLSRIYYDNRFYDYPLKPLNALKGLGPKRSLEILQSYLAARLNPHATEETFEQWVTNRFGARLYQTFFKTYTEKVWGIPCNEISASWAAQRIKGLSMASVLKTALLGNRNNAIKSLIDQFDYPRLGPGQLYEAMANQIQATASRVLLNTAVENLQVSRNRITTLQIRHTDGSRQTLHPQQLISSMPVTELIHQIQHSPAPRKAASQLNYRSLLTVNLMFDSPGTLPDTWLYIHSPEVHVGRIQSFHNWSPDMVPSPETSSLGMEYFCNENDSFWNRSDADLIQNARAEIKTLGLADLARITDAFVYRCPKAYPVYDHTHNLWAINTDEHYQEEQQTPKANTG